MATRSIIRIDEEKCDGCGLCIPACPEGALEIVDGKARLVADFFCDGLGACIGECPKDAILIEEREAEAYDERKVMESIVKQGDTVILEHLEHLEEHNETDNLRIAKQVLKEKEIMLPERAHGTSPMKAPSPCGGGCPGSAMADFTEEESEETEVGAQPSQLRQWPVQLHLVSPMAPYFQDRDVLLAADCVAYSLGDFHPTHLKGKSLAIACPKLDSNQDIYREKITALIDNSRIDTLTIMTMEVPCCSGLVHLAKRAAEEAERKVPIKSIIVGVRGEVLSESWL